MVSELKQGNDNLVPVDYSNLLQEILRALRNYNPFEISANHSNLTINIDNIAASVATSGVQNPLTTTKSVRTATVNFSQSFRESFPTQIQEIVDCLEQQLASRLPEGNIEQFVLNLTRDLISLQGETKELGLSFPFDTPYTGVQQQQLIIDENSAGSNSLLKFHKLSISVGNITDFQSQLKEGLENHVDNYFDGEDVEDLEQVYNLLENQVRDESSNFHKLQRLVDNETLGKLKKEAKIIYLEHLLNNIETQDALGGIYLRDLIRRLRIIEDYINSKPASEYEVYYAGVNVNYQDIFSRAEVFDALPIIPIIAGNLAESTDKTTGKTEFFLGLKLKFNGKVLARGGKEVFEYNLDLMHPDNEEHQRELDNPNRCETFARKVLIRVFLYYFVFSCPDSSTENYDPNNELSFDPIPNFENKIYPVLHGADEERKKTLFKNLVSRLVELNVKGKIQRLSQLMKNFIDRQAVLPVGTYNRQISVSREIITKDSDRLSRGDFFDEQLRENPKKCLRYISIGETSVDVNAVCQLPATIKIEDIRYFLGKDSQKFQFQFDIPGIKTIPIFWIPNTNPCWQYYQNFFQNQYKHILFPYDNARLNPTDGFNSAEAFVYRFVWMLLSYLCLHILLNENYRQTGLFVPMIRLHQGTDQEPFPAEKFLAHLSKVLCHIFQQEHRCNSQGFRVNKKPNVYTIRNGLSSLYSVLPKKFGISEKSEMPSLEKLAIIIISSRESDARKGNWNRENRIVNLMGEVVSIERLEDSTIKIQPLTTFSANYPLQRMYRQPTILIDDTMSFLKRRGYQHFLYVAIAPYTSTLHVTQTEEDKGLYFMSPTIINGMKGDRDDLKIYPVFFDKYFVRASKKLAQSLYVIDVKQLTSIAEDTSQKSVVFFNLFNGIAVGDKFYNGVISYSTLLGNFYPDVMDDRDIRQGLIYDSALRSDILQYLTFFHFSRFEKQQKTMSLKLDPYENIIGEEAVGVLSIFPHMTEEIDFNALAFLMEVSQVVDSAVW